MNKLILIFSILFFFVSTSFCQKRGITINAGIGFSKPDLRYAFLEKKYGPNAINNAKINAYFADFDYFLNVSKNIRLFKRISLDMGLGYSFLKSKPRLPVSNGFFEVEQYIFITSRIYHNHNLQIPIGLQYSFIDKERLKLGIFINNLVNISMLKQINKSSNNLSITDNLKKREFEPHSIETFSGLFAETKRIRFSLDYRFFNGKFKDDAIANNGLPFDKYNPLKFRFGIGYKF